MGLMDGNRLPRVTGYLCQLPTTSRKKNMNDREILAACLRWHTVYARRLVIGAEQRRFQLEQRQRTGFGGSDLGISRRLTAAKRVELAALRALAKVCASVRGSQQQVTDANVIDVCLDFEDDTAREVQPRADPLLQGSRLGTAGEPSPVGGPSPPGGAVGLTCKGAVSASLASASAGSPGHTGKSKPAKPPVNGQLDLAGA